MNKIDLEGRVAVVTGGSGEIGKSIAKRLLQSGASVWLWDLSEEGLKKACSELSPDGQAQWQRVDICDPANVEAALVRATQGGGRVDILVNNAGISGAFLPLEEYPLDEWQRVLNVNLTGAFICSKAVVPVMREGGYGRIVNVASVAAKEGTPRLSAYSAAKAGLVAMTKALGKELADTKILVNCIAPGPTRTRMTAESPPEQVALMVSKSPMKRMMEPHEVAAMVAWLCSEDCSYTTGSVHDLSGGRSTY